MIYSHNVVPTIIMILLYGWMASFMWKKKAIPGARALAFCMLSTMTATILTLAAISIRNQVHAVFLLKCFNLFGSCFALTGYFLMIAQFTGNRFFLRPPVLAFYASFLFMAFFFAHTGRYYHFDYRIVDYHGWRTVRFGNGPWFIADQMFLFISTGCALFMLIRYLYESRKQFTSTALLTFAAILPYIETYIALNTPLGGIPKINYSFCTFFVADLIAIVALLMTGEDELIQTARDKVVENTQDIVLILNTKNIVMDANNKAIAALGGDRKNIVGRSSGEALSAWENVTNFIDENAEGMTKLRLSVNQTYMTFLITLTTIKDGSGKNIGRLLALRDITEMENRDKIEQRSAQLHALTQKVIETQESERGRIGRELHDDFGHKFLSLSLKIEALRKKGVISDDEIAPIEELVQGTSDELMRIYRNLKPTVIEHLGLSVAISSLARNIETNNDIIIETKMDSLEKNDIDYGTALGIYRITQESFTNIIKHAEAKNVSVELRKDERGITLRIADDGKGMRNDNGGSPSGIGIMGMRERASAMGGNLKISSGSTGTVIALTVPANIGSVEELQ